MWEWPWSLGNEFCHPKEEAATKREPAELEMQGGGRTDGRRGAENNAWRRGDIGAHGQAARLPVGLALAIIAFAVAAGDEPGEVI